MSIIDSKSVLRELKVEEAMRRLVIRMAYDAPLEQATRYMIKYKVNAILITGEEENDIGVVSKTDLMGAYYAAMPSDTAVASIMMGPPLFCRPDDSLDAALEMMRERGIHRLYVSGESPDKFIGVLAYPDIVGILYRYCCRCERSLGRRGAAQTDIPPAERLKVYELMTSSVHPHAEDDTLYQVMEGLSSHNLGAALIIGEDGRASGIISKTDLIIAYRHGVFPGVTARTVMNSPVIACSRDMLLEIAIHTMIFSDVHRIFVYKENPSLITGVLSLTDASRVRSGTCRACIATRVKM